MKIYVPAKLLARIAEKGFNHRRREATLLMWWHIDSSFTFSDKIDEDDEDDEDEEDED